MRTRTAITLPGASFVVLVSVLLSAAITGCQRDDDNPIGSTPLPPGAVIAIIGPSQSDPRWPGIRGGAMRYDESHPNLSCFADAPEIEDAAHFEATVGRALAWHPVAVCLYVRDPETARVAAMRVVQEHVLLVTVGREIAGVDAYGSLEASWPEAAEILGRSLNVIGGGPSNPNLPGVGPSYVLIHEDGKDTRATQCYSRFIVAAHSRATLSLLAQHNGAASGRTPREIVEDTIREYPNVRLVVTLNPEPWYSVTARLKLPKRNRFATLGAPPRLWPRLESGEAAGLVGPLDGDLGYAAVDMAVKGVMQVRDPLTHVDVPCELVTRENLADFATRYAAAANMRLADLAPFLASTQPTTAPATAP